MSLFLPALMMSIAWALRGSLGGGPLAAMIPGALWAMAVASARKWNAREASLFVGVAAIGIGLGGQETYSQTVGLLREPDTRLWGLLGLAIKGMVWGLLGGSIISLAWLTPKRPLTVSLVLLVATQFGWQFLNQPKLIYFSNRIIQPRQEIWAGLGFSALALLLLLRHPIANRLALFGAIGGAIGFSFGSLFTLVPVSAFPGLKLMELSFGLALGAFLYFAIPSEAPLSAAPLKAWQHFSYPVLAAITIAINLYLPVRFSFTAAAAILLLILPRYPQLGWTIGFSVTLAAACFELHATHEFWAIALAVAPQALLAWWLASRKTFNLHAMLLLLVCCVWIWKLQSF